MVGTWRDEDHPTTSPSAEWLARVQRLPVVQEGAVTVDSRRNRRRSCNAHLDASGSGLGRTDLPSHARASPCSPSNWPPKPPPATALPRLLEELLDRRLTVCATQSGPLLVRWASPTAHCPMTSSGRHRASRGGTDQCLRELGEQRLLAATTSPHDVQLRHPLLAEAIRRRLVAGEASAEHRRLATVLAASAIPPPAEIAAHWRAAGDAIENLNGGSELPGQHPSASRQVRRLRSGCACLNSGPSKQTPC